jgi:hypothetical protein
MRRSVWMHPWDLCGRDPDRVIDHLLAHGLDACSLALSYHGGRLLLPAHPSRVVYEQHPGALYFFAAVDRFPAALRPAVASETSVAEAFLVRARKRGFPVEAWTVFCHQDGLAASAPRFAVTNAFGETYSHALCPAHDAVQEFCAELGRQAAAVPGVTGLDLEALSFLGYEHGGLHDKRGIPVSKDLAWWLNICCCAVCRKALPGIDAEIRQRVRQALADPYGPAPAALECEAEIHAWRRRVQLGLLRRLREAVPGVPLNLRASPDPRCSIGKSTLSPADVAGIAERITFTFFGSTVAAMQDGVAQLPRHAGVARNIGFIFHEPDCRSAADLQARAALAARAGADGASFYCFGMAAEPHWNWLQSTIENSLQEKP